MSNPIDLGYRIEVRAVPSDPMSWGGRLIASAYQVAAAPPAGSRWEVSHRDGRKVSVATKTEAALVLLRMVDDTEAATVPADPQVERDPAVGQLLAERYGTVPDDAGQRHARAVEVTGRCPTCGGGRP